MESSEDKLSLRAVGRILGISQGIVRGLCDRGELEASQVAKGQHRQVTTSAVLAYCRKIGRSIPAELAVGPRKVLVVNFDADKFKSACPEEDRNQFHFIFVSNWDAAIRLTPRKKPEVIVVNTGSDRLGYYSTGIEKIGSVGNYVPIWVAVSRNSVENSTSSFHYVLSSEASSEVLFRAIR